MWPCWIRLIYDYFYFCSDFCSHELNNWNNFWVMPLFFTKRLWNIHNLSRIQKGWFHQGGVGGGGGVHNPNFARYVPRQSKKWARAPDELPVAKLFIPPQFRTPVGTHLHTANQRPRVLICIQPIHRGWFNPRYKLVRTTLLLSTARGVVVRATCIALHYTACSRGVSSNPLAGFFFAIIKWVTMAFIPSEEIPKIMMK